MRALLIIGLVLFPLLAFAQETGGQNSYSDAQAASAASALTTGFTSPNLQMPNSANVSHTIYNSTASGTVNSTTATSCFGGSGSGSQTPTVAAFFVGANFQISCAGTLTTGALNTATLTGAIKFGSTTIITGTTAALPISLAGTSFVFNEACTVTASGVSGAISCAGNLTYTNGLTSAALAITGLNGSSSVNLSSGMKIDAQLSFSNTTSSPSLTSLVSTIQQVN